MSRNLEKCTMHYWTLFRIYKPQPKTLEEYLEQEVSVANSIPKDRSNLELTDIKPIETHYLKHKDSEEYDVIFNF